MADEAVPPGHWWDAGDSYRPPVPGFDAAVPSPARIYDYYLGGKDNFAVDREAAEKALSVVPDGRWVARANRSFLVRAVSFMAQRGIRQFIDLGTGIPTSPSVHEVAREVHADARVLYVDNEPSVTVHNRALLATSEGVVSIDGDIRHSYEIFASTEMQELIDFDQPVGVLLVAVLHFISDSDDPEGIVRAFTKYMAPSSYLALSHITSDGTEPQVMATIQEAYAKASAPAVFRTKFEIQAFFAGLDMEGPGLVDVTEWTAYERISSARPTALRFLAGIGRQP
jgi:hypothetical protein